MRVFSAIFLVILICSGCSAYKAQDIRMYNREQLVNLELGMNREMVMETMGNETFSTDVAINNPYRIEVFQPEEGVTVEVLYYYTDVKDDDNAISDEELLPIVLVNGEVIGWGGVCLRQQIPQDLLPAEEVITISR
jgi:hypothetical protein